jgi:hypothetical protein
MSLRHSELIKKKKTFTVRGYSKNQYKVMAFEYDSVPVNLTLTRNGKVSKHRVSDH